ncbi:tRNA pseudouridine(55) synthase TruB [Allosphingosinicella indica]|uniref:tRNA pseudouridine synthase B n=1 Tax=Allosphingosinicella indica TaxID=941907 RepID=A0A1X7G159_9SPHN|nr:tRNA pseudouridine(55) synthase TruB [Allosphingosinicella indica]SMF61613.1 tRNA pseudouridine synthase B [Allosphingosinicella indica]
MALHGWLILDKPLGLGSTQAVSAVKRALREGGYAKVKVGHGGTLDPLASGVLPVALGEATKLSGRMLDADKAYDFTIAFGVETDTLDLEGETIATSDQRPTLAEIEAVLERFTGPIDQVPPSYSALKVDGKRAYDRARAGETVELASRHVTIHALSILPGTGRGTAPRSGVVEGARCGSLDPLHQPAAGPPPRSGEVLAEITLSARVSKGTYIRSLARDIALALGTVGHVAMLRRTKAGPFGLEGAISLDNLAEAAKARDLERLLLPLTAGLDDIPALTVSPDQAKLLRQGQRMIGTAHAPGLLMAIDGNGVPVALAEAVGPEIRVVRGFNL